MSTDRQITARIPADLLRDFDAEVHRQAREKQVIVARLLSWLLHQAPEERDRVCAQVWPRWQKELPFTP